MVKIASVPLTAVCSLIASSGFLTHPYIVIRMIISVYLMRTLMQLPVDIRPYKAKTDLSGYIHLCAEIGPSYNQGLAMAAALQGTTVQAMLSQH